MIRSIRLVNWRSHENTKLKFADGTNCFIGNMGSGKSSILSGLCYGLFGTFPELQSRKVKLEDIVMKKPFKKEQSEVEVTFDVGEDLWTVKRTIKTGKSLAELRKNGEIIEGQPAKVTDEIERILKIDYDLFTRAIYSEQNQLDMFLTIPKGQRMKKIDGLLAIDKFEDARTTVVSVKNRIKKGSIDKKQFIESLSKDENLVKVEYYKSEVIKFGEDIKKYAHEIEKVTREKQNIMENIKHQKEKHETLQEIEKQRVTMKALLEQLDKDIEKMKEDLMENAEKTTDELKEDLKCYESDFDDIKNNLTQEKIKLEGFRNENIQAESKILFIENERLPKLREQISEKKKLERNLNKQTTTQIRKEIEKIQKQIKKYTIKMQLNDGKIIEVTQSLEDLKKSSSSCPVCDNRLTPAKKKGIINKKKKHISLMKSENRKLIPETEKLEKDLKKEQKKLEETETLLRKYGEIKDSPTLYSAFEKELKLLKAGMKSYFKEKAMYEKNIELWQKKQNEMLVEKEKTRQLITKRIEIDSKLQKQKEYTMKVIEMRERKNQLVQNFSPQTLDMYERNFRNLIGNEREYLTRIENANTMIDDKNKFIEELEKKRIMIERYKTEVLKYEELERKLNVLESSLVYTQEKLREDFVLAVNQAMQSVWDEIYPYKDFTNIRLAIEKGDYVLQLQDSTGWVPVDGVVSGGERSIASLTLRIAFSLILAPQLKWLFLDEPTHNLDSNAVEELSNTLRDRISNIVDQVFLITHNNSLENAVTGYLYKFERNKGKDEISKVSLLAEPNN